MSQTMNQTNITALAIASSADNISQIVSGTPAAYQASRKSHDNCIAHCRTLLEEIEQSGMTDDLDRKAAQFIERSRRTVRDMNERRSPVTKLFDQVRREFTVLENEVDPAKSGSIPYRLQEHRNRYAAWKREQEEARRRAEEARRQAELARESYRVACEEDYKVKFNELVVAQINSLSELAARVSLDSWQAVFDTVSACPVEIPSGWNPESSVLMPYNLSPDESRSIRQKALESLMAQFAEQYRAEIGDYRQEILDRLPSKKAELERAAKASEEEARRIREEIRQREEAEAVRKEQKRLAREADEARKAEVRRAESEAASLFDLAQTGQAEYQPKTKVSKKIRVINPAGFLPVLMMWWAKEGSAMPVEELTKIFKKQVSFCERLANKEGEIVCDPNVEYIDDVKAQ